MAFSAAVSRMLPARISYIAIRNISLAGEHLPVITMPVKLRERISKIRKKMEVKEREKKRQLSMAGDPTTPIITCKRSELNHNKGQSYSKFASIKLATKGWQNKKSDGDYFTINSHAGNPASALATSGAAAFDHFDLRPELVERLHSMEIEAPTSIQSLAIPRILAGENVMCAAETGSGKTLAYLIPIIDQILNFKDVANMGAICSPLGLILVPGRELAYQVQKMLEQLVENLNIKCTVLIGGIGTKKLMWNPPVEEVDVLVSTLGVIKKLVSTGIYNISKVRHVVIDEADTMLDDSFNETTIEFLKKFRFRDSVPSSPINPDVGAQMILVGATMPRSLDTILHDVVAYESVVQVATPHLHRLMPHVPQKFLRLKPSKKPAKLIELVKPDARNRRKVMIFSKDSATCDFIKMFLEENGIPALQLHANMAAKWRQGRFDKFQDGSYNVLSCTDIGSRGLDTISVQHIINYDFPTFMSDYIHRAGRVGRVGSIGTGHVTNFITTPREVELAQKIELAARRTVVLPNVNANIKRKLLADAGLLDGDVYV